MLKVGLTGGIGSGKSEVARLLAGHGAVVVDADQLAREVLAPGTPGLAEVVAAFGTDVLLSDGALDRPALAGRVFGDDGARARLDAIVHPRIGVLTAERFAVAPPGAVVVHDVPLLVEVGLAAAYDVVVVVAAREETQLERLVGRRGMTEADARARMAAQAPLAEKLAVADLVVWNDGDRRALAARVDEVWGDLSAAAARRGSGPSTAG